MLGLEMSIDVVATTIIFHPKRQFLTVAFQFEKSLDWYLLHKISNISNDSSYNCTFLKGTCVLMDGMGKVRALA